MQRLQDISFKVPDQLRDRVRELLEEFCQRVPDTFANERCEVVATSHSVVLPEGATLDAFLARLKESGISAAPFIRSRRKYSRSEMTGASLFWMHVLKQRGDGYTVCGTQYGGEACPECGAGVKQQSSLVIDCTGFAGYHFAATYNFELVVSSELALALKPFTGFELRPIIDAGSGQLTSSFRQFCPHEQLPTLVPPTRFTRSTKFCRSCRNNGVYLDSEMHIEREPVPEVDAYHTRELFGEVLERGCPGPEYALSARVIERIRGFDRDAIKAEPVFLAGGGVYTSRPAPSGASCPG